jgi:hypothetical protein
MNGFSICKVLARHAVTMGAVVLMLVQLWFKLRKYFVIRQMTSHDVRFTYLVLENVFFS